MDPAVGGVSASVAGVGFRYATGVTRERLRELLQRVERGELSQDALVEELVRLPFRQLEDVRLDWAARVLSIRP